MRARTLKGQIHLNEDLARLGDSAYKLFTGLLGLADRDGRLEDRPERIKAAVAPYHGRPGFPDLDCENLLRTLEDHGFIQRYDSDCGRCIQIASWKKHARPHKDEVSLNLPEPPEVTSKPGNFAGFRENTRSISDLRSSNIDPLSSTLAAGKPRRGRVESEKAPKERDELFDAVAGVTASDPKASGSYVGRVCKALRSADPPYTPAEVHKLAEIAPVELPWLKGRLTLGLVEQFIGLVRAAPSAPRVTKSAFEEALHRHRSKQA